jgi:PPE-repeat protein
MDFGALPPEINSARMYAGPGASSLLTAATAWSHLAVELHSALAAYRSVITGLTSDGWKGPSSAAMAAAAWPYATWMADTAAGAEHTASQAGAAAAAFGEAYAMTVPPPVIAANRAQLALLVATNFLGQNSPAIAATEALYAQMWGQDAAAMYGYAGRSAAASKVTPFAAPQQIVSPAAQAGQTAAVGQAAGTGAQSQLSQLISAMPATLQSLASPSGAIGAGSGLSGVSTAAGFSGGDLSNAMSNLMSSSFSPMGMAGITQMGADLAILRGAALTAHDPLGLGGPVGMSGLGMAGLGLSGLAAPTLGPGTAALGPASLTGTASAAAGRASLVGSLSVPQAWTAATPVANPPATSISATRWIGAAPEAGPRGVPGVAGVPTTGLAGRGLGFAVPRYGFKPTVMPRPVVAG